MHILALHTQLGTHLFVIVNLAVERDQVATSGALHWLVPRRTQVKDGETAMAEPGRFGHKASTVVRSATFQARKHGLNDGEILSFTAITVDTCDSTHVNACVELH